jgi:hypothetical protein
MINEHDNSNVSICWDDIGFPGWRLSGWLNDAEYIADRETEGSLNKDAIYNCFASCISFYWMKLISSESEKCSWSTTVVALCLCSCWDCTAAYCCVYLCRGKGPTRWFTNPLMRWVWCIIIWMMGKLQSIRSMPYKVSSITIICVLQ